MTSAAAPSGDGSAYVPLLDVSLLATALCLLAARGTFDRCDVELDHDGYGEYPSLYARRLPRWLLMPFNTAVNALYPLCGWYWLRLADSEQEPKPVRGPSLMPAEAAYWFQAYGWLCALRGVAQALFMVVQDLRLAALHELSRLLLVSWCALWCLRLLGLLGRGTSRFMAALLLPVAYFAYCLRRPRGHERAQVCN
ncbi:unnamed protein product [Ixodes hexagonus]